MDSTDNTFEQLKSKFENSLFLRGLELSYVDFVFYLGTTKQLFERTHSGEIVLKLTGKQMKVGVTDEEVKKAIDDDDVFYFLPERFDSELRRSFENCVSRAVSFRDRTLRLINSWSGLHLKGRDVKLETILGSMRMYDHPRLRAAVRLLKSPTFEEVNSWRNESIHSESPDFQIEEDEGKILVKMRSSKNLFNRKLDKTSINIADTLIKLQTEMENIVGLLAEGVDDMRSEREKMFP